MSAIRFAKGLNLPLDAVTQTFGIIGRKGSGKTYGAGVLVEGMLDAGAQVVVLDPVGNWYGLRLAADGKGEGFDLPIFGGEHGDVPLTPESGALIADLLVDKRLPAVLDVSHFRKAERLRFVTAFAEQLYHRQKTARQPVHLVLEEAQKLAPQQPGKDSARMLGAIEDIVRMGRNYGIGATLISQRPQSVNKEVLSQVECLCVFQTNGAHERKAIEGWVVAQGVDVAGMVRELPSLPRGECFVWSPQWLGVLDRHAIAKKRTFDASATPEVGGKRAKAVQVRSLDSGELESLRGAMAEVVERVEADDPKKLKARIRQLEREAVKAAPEADQRVVDAARAEAFLEGVIEGRSEVLDQVKDRFQEIDAAVGKVASLLRDPFDLGDLPEAPRVKHSGQSAKLRKPVERAVSAPVVPALRDPGDLPPRRVRILDAIASLEQHFNHPPRELVAAMAGTGFWISTFERDCGALRNTEGLIAYNVPGTMNLTDAGRAVATTRYVDEGELHAVILAQLPPRRQRILSVLIDAGAEGDLSRAELAERAGTKATVSTFERDLGWLRNSARLIEYPSDGYVRAVDKLFL